MTFNSFITLIEKNLKIFFRSRVSSVFIILLPLFVVLLSGYGFSSENLSGVVVGVYYESSSSNIDNLLNKFEEKGFSIQRYDSLESCVDSVRIAENQICVSFFSNSSNEELEKVTFHVDYSRVNLAHTLINIVGEDVSSGSLDISEGTVQSLINKLLETKAELEEINLRLESSSNVLEDIDNLGESIENPSEILRDTINDLEEFENASQISSEIDSLKSLKENISSDFENLDDLNSKIDSLSLEIDSLILEIDSLIIILDSANTIDAENIVSPIDLELESIIPESSKRDFLIPTIISLISLFGAVLIASTFVLKNKKTRAYFRNFVTPTRDLTFVVSTYLTCLIILIMQFILVFLGSYFLFEMNFFSMPLEIFSILFLSWSVFIFIGMFLGYLFKSEETIIFSAVLISSALMFFSNLILPLENISESLFRIAQFNPFVILENSFKQVYLFGLSFDSIWIGLAVLGGFFLVFGILTWVVRKLNKRRL
jgi:ABC-type multidrug transport system permease subunit